MQLLVYTFMRKIRCLLKLCVGSLDLCILMRLHFRERLGVSAFSFLRFWMHKCVQFDRSEVIGFQTESTSDSIPSQEESTLALLSSVSSSAYMSTLVVGSSPIRPILH